MKSPKLRVPTKEPTSPNALAKYSLLGSAARLEELALDLKPLLGSICLMGEATVWFGKYGLGKTLFFLHLLMEAVTNGRIRAGDVYYINADDSAQGLAQKVRLCEEYGIHVLSPGHKGFRANMLMEKMTELILADQARGAFVILDTLKKYVDPMSKTATRGFTEVVREFVLRGGTVLALAHTNKRLGPDGKPVPEGTADILNDFDCAYLLDHGGEVKGTNEKVVVFTREKSRGPTALTATYAYDPDPHLSYTERLCTIREVSDDHDCAAAPISEEEADIIEAIEMCIMHGPVTKMDIARTTAKSLRHVSARAALNVLEKFTGDDPSQHRWNYERREHGRMVFSLHPDPERGD
jgi:hypothetical protein